MSFKSKLAHLYAPHHLIKGEWLGNPYNSKEVYSTLSRIAWPATLETVLIGLLAFVDSIMVSSVGSEAIAAVGITNQPRMLFYAVFFALNVGVTAVVSRRKGEEDREAANRTLSQAVAVCSVLGVILFTFSFIFSRPLLIFAGAQSDTIDVAVTYFRIVMLGTIFTSIGLMINAAHRGCGNTKISMYTNLTANFINFIFNLLLINGLLFFPRLEVKGAAIATLIGNIASCLISIYSVTVKGDYLKLKLSDIFKFDSHTLKSLTKVGSSAAVEQVFVRIGFFAYVKIIASLGTQIMATHQICMSIITLSFTFGDGLSISASSLVGQNLGRKRPDMATIYGKATQRVGFLISLALFLLFSTGGGMLVSLFTNESEIINLGSKLLLITAFASPAQISQLIFSGSLRGAGDTKYVAYTSLIAIGIIRPIITYILCYPLGLGLIGAWLSLLFDQYLRLAFASTRFIKGKWKNIDL